MHSNTPAFSRLRPRLQSIAYRMLGSVAEAEDVVQDIWLRWNEATGVANAEAWLVAATTRLAIDRLRSAKVRREHYTGIWLPEPVLADGPATPEQTHELADEVSVAFLLLLERLEPQARAAFLLREVFDTDYRDIAETLGRSEAACRQIVSRAKAALGDATHRRTVPRAVHAELTRRFAKALSQGDFAAIQALLAEDAELTGDGGGKVVSFPTPLRGGRRIAQLFYATYRRFGDAVRLEMVQLNGSAALLRFIDGALESAQTFETDGERIVAAHVQRNPDKLARIAALWPAPLSRPGRAGASTPG